MHARARRIMDEDRYIGAGYIFEFKKEKEGYCCENVAWTQLRKDGTVDWLWENSVVGADFPGLLSKHLHLEEKDSRTYFLNFKCNEEIVFRATISLNIYINAAKTRSEVHLSILW